MSDSSPQPDSLSTRMLRKLCKSAALIHARVERVWTRVTSPCVSRWLGLPMAVRLASLQVFMGLVCVTVVALGGTRLSRIAGLNDGAIAFLHHSGNAWAFGILKSLLGVSLALAIGAVAVSGLRRRLSLILIQVSTAWFLVTWFWCSRYVFTLPASLYENVPDAFDKASRDVLWIRGVSLWMFVALVAGAALMMLCTGAVGRYYGGKAVSAPLGDRVLAWHRAKGRDRTFRIALRWAIALHVCLFIVPLLIRSCGWETAVLVPQGAGNEQIKVVRVKPRKQTAKWMLARDSPFIFERPEIDRSDVMEDVDRETESQYAAQSLAGKPGEGAEQQGGWPNGMPGKVRFIRLQYRGGDWDQDMGRGADDNFLMMFNRMTGFPVANHTEARPASRLRLFPRHKGPPFVYVTGKGGISVSEEDVKTLRWYCLEQGGMIWGDNGGGSFDGAFRQLMTRVFPGERLIDIANDDPIYHHPYSFPYGAPPLWHHSGYRALGIRHDGRWVAFYHQGDMNDAWKDGPDASEAVAMQSFKMGINIAHYAFTSYLSTQALLKTD